MTRPNLMVEVKSSIDARRVPFRHFIYDFPSIKWKGKKCCQCRDLGNLVRCVHFLRKFRTSFHSTILSAFSMTREIFYNVYLDYFFTPKKFHPRWLLLIIHTCGTHVNVRQNRNVWVGLSYFRKKHIYSLFMLSKLFFVNYCFIISLS